MEYSADQAAEASANASQRQMIYRNILIKFKERNSYFLNKLLPPWRV